MRRPTPEDWDHRRDLLKHEWRPGDRPGDRPPLELADCGVCGGQGYIARTIHVYAAGCGFSHPDVEETPCQACGGNGWLVCEAEGDR